MNQSSAWKVKLGPRAVRGVSAPPCNRRSRERRAGPHRRAQAEHRCSREDTARHGAMYACMPVCPAGAGGALAGRRRSSCEGRAHPSTAASEAADDVLTPPCAVQLYVAHNSVCCTPHARGRHAARIHTVPYLKSSSIARRDVHDYQRTGDHCFHSILAVPGYQALRGWRWHPTTA